MVVALEEFSEVDVARARLEMAAMGQCTTCHEADLISAYG